MSITKINRLQLLKFFLSKLWDNDYHLKSRFLLAWILILFAIGLDIMVPMALKFSVSLLVKPTTHQALTMMIVVLSLGLIWTLSKIISQLRQIFMYRVFEHSINKLSVDLLSHLFGLSFKQYLTKETGAIINAIDRAVMSIPNVFWGLFFVIIPTLGTILFASAILYYLYGWLYGFILLIAISLFIIFTLFATHWSIKYQRSANEANKIAGAFIVDRLMNFTNLKYLLTKPTSELSRYQSICKVREDAMTKQLIYNDLVGVGQAIIIGISLILLSWITSQAILVKHSLNVSDFVLISGYLLQFATPLATLGFIFRQIIEGITNLEDIMTLFLEKSSVQPHVNAKSLVVDKGEINFKNVFFSYNNYPILHDISFNISAGKTVAIVGATGSGKSTIIKLLLNLYDIDKGYIFIDGQNIKDCSHASIIDNIAVVSQECLLFNETILFNLTYPNLTVSKESIESVIQAVKLDKLIQKLPHGIHTTVGEKGAKLSGGEKQRITIARALLKKAKILILDEATSSLDALTECEIQKNIANISKDTTTIIIAHKLSTITHADQILFLNHNGRIVDKGSHNELLENNSAYIKMWRHQQSIIVNDM